MSLKNNDRQNTVDLGTSSVGSISDVRRVGLAGGLGTLIEYYDFALYGYVSTIIAPLFFPSSDPVASLLAVLLVFALSYVIRPVGGIFFGWVGDRFGRRRALLITVIGIGLANFALGCLPTYSVAGVLAPTLLVVVRVFQGFFAGGEVGGAATAISEAAPAGRKSRYAAFVPMGTNGGFAIASATIGIVSGLVTTQDLNSYGWRIPFLIGLPLTVICYFARRSLPDIDTKIEHSASHGFPIITALREYPGALIKATALGIGVQGGAYIGSTFIAIYLVSDLGYDRTPVYWLTAAVTILSVAVMPFTGRLADRIGPLAVSLIGLAGYTVLTYPGFLLMGLGNFALASVGFFIIIVNMAFVQVGSYTVTPQLFDDRVRYTGTALATNISVVIAGGTAPYIATLLVSTTQDLRSPYYFVAATSVIGLLSILALWKKRKQLV